MHLCWMVFAEVEVSLDRGIILVDSTRGGQFPFFVWILLIFFKPDVDHPKLTTGYFDSIRSGRSHEYRITSGLLY